MSLDLSKLTNVRPNSLGWDCACPICAQSGQGLRGQNQLRIFRSGAFHCLINSDADHNTRLRAFLRGLLSSEEQDEVVYVQPRKEIEQVYPESVLDKLIPQYDYWFGRGIKESVLRATENGLAPVDEKGKLAGRTIFPCRNRDDQIVGFAGRLVSPNSYGPKWKIIGPKKTFLFPWRLSGTPIKETKTCVLVESVGDSISLASNGITNNLCLFGLHLSGTIVATLIEHDIKRVVVSLNRDENPNKGQAAADKIANRLGSFFTDVRVVLPPEPFKDWGEVGQNGATEGFNGLREAIL